VTVPHPPVRIGVIGINHAHIYGQVDLLLRAGAELVSFFAREPELTSAFSSVYPQARVARVPEDVLEDPTIDMIVTAAIPDERAEIGIAAMRHGKDVMSDKPAFTSLAQLDLARRVQRETGRIYSVCYSERFENAATVRAGELVHAGAIGKVIQTIGLGPHRANFPGRPGWFFDPARFGGILADIAAHQADQFLFFTGSTTFEIVAAQVANFHHPQYPRLEDFGDIMVRGEECTGYMRVDWFTPTGLPTWGDTRLTVLGTEGYIEVRKNCDIEGRPGGEHLFLVDNKSPRYINCSGLPLPYGPQLVADVRNRTETCMSQAHCFLASQLVLEAQQMATRLGHLALTGR
jgi:predicted dehydrogenase